MQKQTVAVMFFVAGTSPIAKTFAYDGCPAVRGWQVTESDIAKIELAIEMPKNAHALNRYSRYYAATTEDGAKHVRAIFRLDDVGERRVLDFCELPLIVDGGCQVLKLKYNIETHVVVQFSCNGKG